MAAGFGVAGTNISHGSRFCVSPTSSPHLPGEKRVLGAGVGARLLWLCPAAAFLLGWF